MAARRYILVTVEFFEEEGQWVAKCEELGSVALGSTCAEAKEAIEEAMALKVEALSKAGELERFLGKHNIPVYTRKPTRRRDTAQVPVSSEVYIQRQVVPVH